MYRLFFLFLVSAPFSSVAGQADPEKEEAANLKRCWDIRAEIRPTAGLAADPIRGYYADNLGRVVAVDIRTGETAWSTEIGGMVGSNLVVTEKAVYVVGSAADKPAFVNALSPLTGLPLWRTEIPASDEFYLGLTGDRLSVVSAAGEVRSLNAVNGQPSWKISIRGTVSSTPKFSDERIVISTRTNRVEAISTATGSTTSSVALKFEPAVVGVGNNDAFVYTDGKGAIVSNEDGGSQKWKFRAGGKIDHVVTVGNKVLIGSADNFVYFLTLDGGNLLWKRRLSGRIASSGMVGENRAAFTVFGERNAWIIDLDDGRVVDQITLAADDAFLLTPVKANGKYLLAATMNGLSGFSTECAK